MTPRTVLVINAGSSSIKYRLINPETAESIASGLVERIGEVSGRIIHQHAGERFSEDRPFSDHEAGLRRVAEVCEEVGPTLRDGSIVAVGHRVVHGGIHFDRATIADDATVARIAALNPLAPLHNPANVRGIEVARALLPHVPHVAVFDTAFFQDLPAAAATYALDRDIAERYAIRRYGFHGTSHRFVSRTVTQLLGRNDLRQVVLHLGNGASASAVVGGHPVETSMGLTPLEGLVMGTRTGDIDPAVAFHLARVAGMDIAALDDLFNRDSGLKGLTGHNDMREVRRLANGGDERALLALAVYVHRLRKYIGAYTAVMGGIDALTFTAGIGENSAELRAEVVAGLGFLGIALDEERNAAHAAGPRVISPDGARVTVLVVPTNEELEIAQQCVDLLGI